MSDVLRAVAELTDPEFCPIPADDVHGCAGWRFMQEHLRAVLEESGCAYYPSCSRTCEPPCPNPPGQETS